MVGSLLLATAVTALSAQPVVSARAGLLYHVEGAVRVDGIALDATSPRFVQLERGQVLETLRGFGEISLGPDRTLRVAPGSEIVMLADDINAAGVELRRGALFVDWDDPQKNAVVRVETGGSVIEIARAGLYRVDARDGPPRLRVYDGRANLSGGLKVTKGREVFLEPTAQDFKAFDTQRRDFFDRWNARRSRAAARMVRAGVPKKGKRGGFGTEGADNEASRRGPSGGFGPGPF